MGRHKNVDFKYRKDYRELLKTDAEIKTLGRKYCLALGRDIKKGFKTCNVFEWLELLYDKNCAYCGIKEVMTADRIDNEKGYELGNFNPSCLICNTLRNKNFTSEEMRFYLGPAVANVIKARLTRKELYWVPILETNENYLTYGDRKGGWSTLRKKDAAKGYFSGSCKDWADTKLFKCVYCGNNDYVGVDRIDNSLGHIVGNMLPACKYCNVGRADNFTMEEFGIFIGPAIREVLKRRKLKTTP